MQKTAYLFRPAWWRHRDITQTLLVMKLTFLFLTVALLNVQARTTAQTITLSGNNIPLQKVFATIKKQTGFVMLTTKDLLKGAKTVSADAHDMPLKEFLDLILKDQSLNYQIAGKTIMLTRRPAAGTTIAAQQVTEAAPLSPTIDVTGKVNDDEGSPLAGASVKIKGSAQGVITNSAGEFTLHDVPDNAVIVISFVGFQSREFAARKDLAVIQMIKGDAKLNEIVVVGYGSQRKSDITGSVATMSSKEIQSLPISNFTNALVGRLPGLVATNPNGRPGSGSNLQIRGISTLNDNSTLIVVDGIVRTDGFQSINPEDVASVTVLKDAAATAVYGARAGNGVILITTKRGVSGKPTINYSANFGIQNPINYPKLLSAYDYASLRNQALLNQGYDPNNPTQALFFTGQADLDKYKNNIGTTNWYDASFKKNSPQSQHAISVSGGNESVKYFTSLGYVNQDGMYSNINYSRYNFRSNLDAKINNNLSLAFNIEARQEDNKTTGSDANGIFYDVIRQRPTQIAYYPDGKPANTAGEHPVEEIRSSGYGKTRIKALAGILSAEQKLPFITQGLSIKGLVSIFTSDSLGKNFFTPYKMYDEDANGNVTNTKVVGGLTSLRQTDIQTDNYTFNLSLNYARSFKQHNVNALILGEQFQSKGSLFTANKTDFVSNSRDQFFASGPNFQTIDGTSYINDTRRSLVGRVNYNFHGKYLLEGSFRYDGSFKFAPGKQWGFFPAISAGWRISEESFFKNTKSLDFVNNLKIRASKGLVGNDRVDAFQYTDSYVINTQTGPVFNGSPASLINYGVYPNSNITWEKQDNNNLGVDMDLFKSKLNIQFDYFTRTTRDILYPRNRSVPATFGRILPAENYAEMKSYGYEIAIGHSNTIGQVSYNVGFNASYSNNKVTKIDDPDNALDFQRQLGKPYGFVAGYQALGLFSSADDAAKWFGGKEFGQTTKAGDIKYADINGDGEITSADQKVLSNNNYTPRVIYGFSGTVRWKGFSFNFLFQGAAKRTLLLTGTGRVLFQNGGSSNSFNFLKDAWSPTNTGASYPLAWVDSRTINDRDSDVWLKNAAYLRLKSAVLGYTFNTRKIKSWGFQNLRIYVSGTNLLTFSKFKEFDPEAETGTGAYYPQQRVLSAGINLGL